MNGVDMTMTQEEAAEATVMATMIKVTDKIRAAERFELASRLLKKAQDPPQCQQSCRVHLNHRGGREAEQ
jgi:hypothetical protein